MLLSKNESHFEHALRLTRALKEQEDAVMNLDAAQAYFMDSKVMLDILYDEIIAEEEDDAAATIGQWADYTEYPNISQVIEERHNLAADDSGTVVGDFSADDRMLGEELAVPLNGGYTNDEIREKIIDLLTKGGFKEPVAQGLVKEVVPHRGTSEVYRTALDAVGKMNVMSDWASGKPVDTRTYKIEPPTCETFEYDPKLLPWSPQSEACSL